MFPIDFVAEIENGDLVFGTATQNAQLCSSVLTSDDSTVEARGSFIIQLVSGLVNERIRIQTPMTSVTVQDNDRM